MGSQRLPAGPHARSLTALRECSSLFFIMELSRATIWAAVISGTCAIAAVYVGGRHGAEGVLQPELDAALKRSGGPEQSVSVPPTRTSSAAGMTVSRDEIDENLRDLPTPQRDEAARLYKGVSIQWAGEVRGVYRGQEDRLVVSLTCRNSVVLMSDTFAVVPYAREVILLREGVKVRVVGTISKIEPGRNGAVWLVPAEISPPAP